MTAAPPVVSTDYCPTAALEYTKDYDLAEYEKELIIWSPQRLSKVPEGYEGYRTADFDAQKHRSLPIPWFAFRSADCQQYSAPPEASKVQRAES